MQRRVSNYVRSFLRAAVAEKAAILQCFLGICNCKYMLYVSQPQCINQNARSHQFLSTCCRHSRDRNMRQPALSTTLQQPQWAENFFLFAMFSSYFKVYGLSTMHGVSGVFQWFSTCCRHSRDRKMG